MTVRTERTARLARTERTARTAGGRRVAGSVEELLGGARLVPMDKPADSLSGAAFARVTLDGERYVVKYVSWELDWITRATADTRCRPLTLWRAGVLDALPRHLDHTIAGVAHDPASGTTALLMRDVADYLVPVDRGRIPLAQHRRFLNHMAALHATFLGFTEDEARRLGLLRPGDRYTVLTPAMAEREAADGRTDPVPRLIVDGWRALRRAAPEAAEYARAVATDPAPLAEAMAETPMTLVHGDWKAGNLGTLPDGRTILLDWAWPGRDGPCVDLAWYLAVNCDLLPEPKEAAIEAFRDALHRHGVATDRWWDRQLSLALLGAFVQLGWSKTRDPVELDWWLRRVLPTARQVLR
jgi:hypothetical protein